MKYDVTLIGSETASDLGDFAEGAIINIDAGIKEGYSFTGWTSEDTITFDNSANAQTFFTMIAKAVTITATWLQTHDNRLKICKEAVETSITNSNWRKYNSVIEDLVTIVNDTVTTTDVEVTCEYNMDSMTNLTTPSSLTEEGSIHYDVTLKLHDVSASVLGNASIPKVPEDKWYYDCLVTGSSVGENGSGGYLAGTTVTINAGTVIGKTFANWVTSEGVTLDSTTNAITTFVMPLSDVTIEAVWTNNDYTVTMDETCDIAGGKNVYNYGDIVEISCNSGDFVEWSCDDHTVVFAAKTNSSTTFVMPANNIIIDHSFQTYEVSITGEYPTTGAGTYIAGATVTLSANAVEEFIFNGWTSSDVVITDANALTATFVMPSTNVSVNTSWTQKVYNVTVEVYDEKVAGYELAKTIDHGNYPLGTEVNINGTYSEPGYNFVAWKVTSGDVVINDTAGENVTFNTTNQPTVLQYQRTKEHSIKITGVNGSTDIESSVARVNDVVTVNAGTRIGYSFTGWTSDNVSFVNANALETTFTVLDGDVTVTATWSAIDYTVTMDESCDITGGGTTTYHVGDTVSITCNTIDLVEWSCSDPTVVFADKTANTTTFTMPAKNITIDHSFKTYTVTVNSPGATGVVGTGSYLAGATVTINAGNKADYYTFDSWGINNASVTMANRMLKETTFTMPSADVTVTATWNSLYTISPAGTVSGSDALKLLPAGSVDLSIPSIIDGISVTSIGDRAFEQCNALRSVIIPEGPTAIVSSAFLNCTALISVIIPNSVTSIDLNAFNGCISLSSVTIGSGVTSIGVRSFRSCSALLSLNIPSNVVVINNDSFDGCTKLTSINIDKPVDAITGKPWGATNATVKWSAYNVAVTGSTLPANQNGSGLHAVGATVTVNAGTPAVGMKFVGWECSTNNVTPL